MTKNPKFHQLRASGKFGLKAWYPSAKEEQNNKIAPKKRGRPRKEPQQPEKANVGNEQGESKK